MGADIDARDGAIGNDENNIDGIDVLLDLRLKSSYFGTRLAEGCGCQPTMVCRACELWEDVTPVHHVQKS